MAKGILLTKEEREFLQEAFKKKHPNISVLLESNTNFDKAVDVKAFKINKDVSGSSYRNLFFAKGDYKPLASTLDIFYMQFFGMNRQAYFNAHPEIGETFQISNEIIDISEEEDTELGEDKQEEIKLLKSTNQQLSTQAADLRSEKITILNKFKTFRRVYGGLLVVLSLFLAGLCVVFYRVNEKITNEKNELQEKYALLNDWASLNDKDIQSADSARYNRFFEQFKDLYGAMDKLLDPNMMNTNGANDETKTMFFKHVFDGKKNDYQFKKYNYYYYSGVTSKSYANSNNATDENDEKKMDKIFYSLNKTLTGIDVNIAHKELGSRLRHLLFMSKSDDKIEPLSDKFEPILIYSLFVDSTNINNPFAYMYRYPAYCTDDSLKFNSYTNYNYSTRSFYLDIQQQRTIFLNDNKNFGITSIYGDYKRNLPVRTVWIRKNVGQGKTCYLMVDFIVAD